MPDLNPHPPRLGVSACVTGEKVRYDGDHKRSDFCADVLARHVDLIAICPEMAIGMGSPRPTIKLVQETHGLIARCSDGRDLTKALDDYGQEQGQLQTTFAGYIFCARSPSCGVGSTKVYSADESVYQRNGTGVYAQALLSVQPNLPFIEDEQLENPLLRDNFLTRIYLYHDWLELVAKGVTAKALIDFHSRCKLLVMAHSPVSYQRLGNLLANLSNNLNVIAEQYISGLMQTLKQPASHGGHVNVLQHIQGYFTEQLNESERKVLIKSIDDYQVGLALLSKPVGLLQEYLRRYPTPYIEKQRYLHPYPSEFLD